MNNKEGNSKKSGPRQLVQVRISQNLPCRSAKGQKSKITTKVADIATDKVEKKPSTKETESKRRNSFE
jgi:23S rRNA pseudouridine2605 synthase